MIKVNLISLGCPKNLVDSEKILGNLGAAGLAITASSDDSDVIIINTCGFIKPALEETEEEIKKVLFQTDNKKIYVYGCAVNRYREELKEKYPQVSDWFRLEERNRLLKTITHKINETRLVTTRGYAYLKIADGCSNHCSYCTIPFIKGEFHSFDFDGLIEEVEELAELGIKEIILIAQDTTRYGLDRYGRPMLVPLIREISKIRNIEWIRILYSHPKTITQEIISEIASNRKVCKYLDMPIQHINDRILQLMNRGVDRKRIETILKGLKKIKGISLRTTVITGFPTERSCEFKEMVKFLRKGYFDWLGVFPYYCEQGTEAAKLEQLPRLVVKKRYYKIIEIQKELIRKKSRGRIGRVFKTLIHERRGDYIGHAEFCAPGIDGKIIVKFRNLKLGEFYNLKLEDKWKIKNDYTAIRCRA